MSEIHGRLRSLLRKGLARLELNGKIKKIADADGFLVRLVRVISHYKGIVISLMYCGGLCAQTNHS